MVQVIRQFLGRILHMILSIKTLLIFLSDLKKNLNNYYFKSFFGEIFLYNCRVEAKFKPFSSDIDNAIRES